jgi:hypothetical protein
MSTGNEYDGYGRILASGGEIAIAFATLRLSDMFKVRARLEKKYGAMPDNVWQKLLSVGDEIIKGGETLQNLPPDEKPTLEMVPRNPYLFGDDWSGKRVRIITHSVNEITGEPVDFWWDLPDLLERSEMDEFFADQLRDYEDTYERLARWLAQENIRRLVKHQIIIAERRY